jgi:hypothetical protein
MIDDQPAHDAGSIPHKARAVRESRNAPPGHVEVRFMEQRRNAEAHEIPASRQLAFR